MIHGLFSDSVGFTILNMTFSTEQLGKNGNPTDWITAIGTIFSAIVALGIALFSFYLTRRNEQKHNLAYVFRLLNDNAHRNARRRIYNLYGEKDHRRQKKILRVMGVKNEDLERTDAIQQESSEIVKADFNEIGSLIENKSVPEKEFLKMYWLEVLKSWTVLCDEIQKIRQIDLNYMENFTKLKCRAEIYRKRENGKHPQVVKDIIITPAVENFKLEKLPWREVTSQKYKISLDLIVEKCDSQEACQTARKFFGKDIAKLVAIDGTEYSRPLFDIIIFYAGAYSCEGEIEGRRRIQLRPCLC
jgi:hypothetical protein